MVEHTDIPHPCIHTLPHSRLKNLATPVRRPRRYAIHLSQCKLRRRRPLPPRPPSSRAKKASQTSITLPRAIRRRVRTLVESNVQFLSHQRAEQKLYRLQLLCRALYDVEFAHWLNPTFSSLHTSAQNNARTASPGTPAWYTSDSQQQDCLQQDHTKTAYKNRKYMTQQQRTPNIDSSYTLLKLRLRIIPPIRFVGPASQSARPSAACW